MATWQHLRSSTANKRPTTSLADGRIAINTNTASPGLFFKDSAGTGIVKVGPVHVGTTAPNSVPAAGGSSGNYTGEQWLDTSVSPAQMKVWNGSTWVGIVADELPVSKLQDGAARQLIQTDAAGTGVEWTSDVDVPGTLDVTSTATFDSIAQHPLGTAGAPTITFTGDNNTGIYSPGADQVAISTGGSGRLFVDASGRVGVGDSTPTVPLDITGSATEGLRLKSDNSSTRGFELFNNSTSDLAYISNFYNGPIIFQTNNTERMRLTSTGLGVGTSSPGKTLDVNGESRCTVAATINNGAAWYTAGDPGGYLYLGNAIGTPASIESYTPSSRSSAAQLELRFKTVNTGGSAVTAMTIDSSQRVGVGTTSPGSPLTIESSAGNQVKITYPSIASYFLNATSGGDFAINKDGSERARIDSSGRLLVGTSTTSASARIIAVGNTLGGNGRIDIDCDTTTPANGSGLGYIVFGDSGQSTGAWIGADRDGGTWSGSSKPSRLVFSTTKDGESSPTERMRIDSGGNLLIGTTSVHSSAKVSIAATKGFVTRPTSAVDYTPLAFETFAGTQIGSIATSGSTTAYNTSSDYRLKENVTAVTDGITRLQQLKPSRFNFIANPDKTVDGFIAHEVQTIVPEAITGEKDAVDDDGNPVYQGIDQSKLVPLLTAALQEAIGEIESLKARVAALESA